MEPPPHGSDTEALLSPQGDHGGQGRARPIAVGAAALVVTVVATAAALLAFTGGQPTAKKHAVEKTLPRWSPIVPAVDRKMLVEVRPRVCTAVSGKDTLGDTIHGSRAFTGEDADGCLELCRKNPDCGCYSFDPSRNRSCWLKKSPCNELYTWQETEDMTTGTCRDRRPQVCTAMFGKDIKGDLLTEDSKFTDDDAVTCRQRCEQTEGCDCYSFDPSRDNTCWLKRGACDQVDEWEESADMLSGICHEQRPLFDWPKSTQSDDGGKLAANALKQNDGASRQFCTIVTGKDLHGADRAPEDNASAAYTNSTASLCRRRCGGTRDCRCYAFDPSRNSTCWLRGGPCDGGYHVWSETGDMVSGTCRQARPLLDWPLRASSREAGLLERFRVVVGARKDEVGLLSHHGTYVTAQSDGSVSVDSDSMGAWETFEEVWLASGRVAFKSFHGGFLAPTQDGMVTANAMGAGEQESFKVKEFAEDGSISLQTAWGRFLTAARLGVAAKMELRADRELVGSWATFILRARRQEGRPPLPDSGWLDRAVTLQSYMGTYVGVGLDGEVTVNVEEKDVGLCEEFKLVSESEDGIALQTCRGSFLQARPNGSVVAVEAEEPGEWERFRIDVVDSKTLFSVLDLPAIRMGSLTKENLVLSNLSQLHPDLVPHKMPQPVVLKTAHGGYLFPLEQAKRVSSRVVLSNGTRPTQAMVFTRTCVDSGLLPIASQSACEAAARSTGLVKATANVSVKIVKDAGVPEGCYVGNGTRFHLGTNTGNRGHGVTHRQDGTVLNPICTGACPKCAMPEPTAPALVILFYERDLCKMRLLASSLTKHDPNQLVGTVHLIWLSTHPSSEFMGDIDSIRNAASASHNVRFHDLSWMFRRGMEAQHVRQIVRLKGSGLVEEDYYVVLDAGSAFVRDVRPDTFLTPCHQGRVFADADFDALSEDAQRSYRASAAALGVDVPPGRKWSPLTNPVVLHTQTVIDMLHYLREDPSPLSLCSGALCGHIRKDATEFALYYLYAATKTDEKCIHRASSQNPAVSMLRGKLELNEGLVQAVVDDAEIVLFGAQRGALSGLDDEVSQRISNQLQEIFEVAGVHDPSSNSADSMAACVVGG